MPSPSPEPTDPRPRATIDAESARLIANAVSHMQTRTARVLRDSQTYERCRAAINESTDIVPPGSEPFVGWSAVLTDRVLDALSHVFQGAGLTTTDEDARDA